MRALDKYIEENYTEEEQERIGYYCDLNKYTYHYELDDVEYLLIYDEYNVNKPVRFRIGG